MLRKTINYDFKASYDKPLRVVEVFVEFMKIGEIDTMNEKYQAEVFIISKWVDNSLKDQARIFDAKVDWHPQIYIENALQIAKEDVSYETKYFDDDNLWVVEKRNVKVTIWER